MSYSWDSENHKQWVRRFTDELIRNGVDTTLDQYDLTIGGDRFEFMESAVRDADCIFCICTPEYVKRANDRDKGVGVETTLITPQFFDSHRNKQFIPIVRRSKPGISYVPDYMSALIFVDFRDDTRFDQSMEELLRHLHCQPKHKKPPVGPVPKFESDDTKGDSSAAPIAPQERELVERLITFLEDRRVLFSSLWGMYGLQSPGTVKSIQEIRRRLVEDLEKLPRGCELADSLWNMQEACRTFLDGYDLLDKDVLGSRETHVLIHDYREVFRNELSKLSQLYDIPMRRLIPPPETLERWGIPAHESTKLMFTGFLEEFEKRFRR